MIFPTIVEERDAAIHGPPHEAYRRALVRYISQMMPTKAQRRDADVVATELSQGNRVSIRIRHYAPPAINPDSSSYSGELCCAANVSSGSRAEKRPAASHP